MSSVVAGNFFKWVSFDGYAEGTTKGVAPYARISMYKVVWNEGIRCSDVVASMDQVVVDGVDVICIAMGYKQATEKLSLEPIVKASFSAIEKGIPVTTAAGNTGPQLGSLSNGIPWVLTVTASTMDRLLGAVNNINNIISNVMCYIMLCILEWMRKGKHRIGIEITKVTWFSLDGLHPWRNPLRVTSLLYYRSVVQ